MAGWGGVGWGGVGGQMPPVRCPPPEIGPPHRYPHHLSRCHNWPMLRVLEDARRRENGNKKAICCCGYGSGHLTSRGRGFKQEKVERPYYQTKKQQPSGLLALEGAAHRRCIAGPCEHKPPKRRMMLCAALWWPNTDVQLAPCNSICSGVISVRAGGKLRMLCDLCQP